MTKTSLQGSTWFSWCRSSAWSVVIALAVCSSGGADSSPDLQPSVSLRATVDAAGQPNYYVLEKDRKPFLGLSIDKGRVVSVILYDEQSGCLLANLDDMNGDGRIDSWLVFEATGYRSYRDADTDGRADSVEDVDLETLGTPGFICESSAARSRDKSAPDN